MSERSGMINEYRCPTCRGKTVTINRDDGTTPFFLKCRASPAGCDEMAQSMIYRVDQNQRPAWEWIRPTPAEFDEYLKAHREEEYRDEWKKHCDLGGMMLIRVTHETVEKFGLGVRRG